jgi:hypothetical protein
VIAWEPAVEGEVVHVALPDEIETFEQIAVPPSKKVTLPVGVPAPGEVTEIVAV